MDVRYPIGKYAPPRPITEDHNAQWIEDQAALPENLRAVVRGMSESQLSTPYREGGWTIRQTVHHVADSHINSYVRFKLALTEENPVIKPYMEAQWAELEDGRNASVDISLALIESVHHRWVILLKSLKSTDFKRTFYHPARNAVVPLDETLGMYSWHGKHHIAHIQGLKNRMNW